MESLETVVQLNPGGHWISCSGLRVWLTLSSAEEHRTGSTTPEYRWEGDGASPPLPLFLGPVFSAKWGCITGSYTQRCGEGLSVGRWQRHVAATQQAPSGLSEPSVPRAGTVNWVRPWWASVIIEFAGNTPPPPQPTSEHSRLPALRAMVL